MAGRARERSVRRLGVTPDCTTRRRRRAWLVLWAVAAGSLALFFAAGPAAAGPIPPGASSELTAPSPVQSAVAYTGLVYNLTSRSASVHAWLSAVPPDSTWYFEYATGLTCDRSGADDTDQPQTSGDLYGLRRCEPER
jgi:hypothetical protein